MSYELWVMSYGLGVRGSERSKTINFLKQINTFSMSNILRAQAEQLFAEELEELKKSDSGRRPANWHMTPQAVVTYLVGGKLNNGFEVSPKYIGNRRLMEIPQTGHCCCMDYQELQKAG